MNASAPTPGGFWHRYAAWSLDFVAIAALAGFATHAKVRAGFAIAATAWRQLFDRTGQAMADAMLAGSSIPELSRSLQHDPALLAAARALQDGMEQATLPFALACAGIALLWHALGETSRWQGSPGKRAFGLIVTDRDGNPPGIARALARQVAGVASWITFNLGHAMAMLPPQHRALHDVIAGTRVLRVEAATRMPPIARLWLWLQLLAGLGALAWGFSRYVALLASIA